MKINLNFVLSFVRLFVCKIHLLPLFSLIFFSSFFSLYATAGNNVETSSQQQQSKQTDILVSGVVLDEQGEPLIGVNVIVKGAGRGTVTDLDGKFSVKVPSESSIINFSYVSFISKSRVVGKERILRVTLNQSSKTIDDVVVVGYGYSKKNDLTGSVGRVNIADLEKAPVKSVDEALGGRVAGVQVTSGDGQPGSNATITIRGVGSVTQSTSPLYVIDGFPQEDANFNSINPSDIESIDVLKDASSTAIYGARGSNGVILITTKRGKTEKPTITYNAYIGTQQPVKMMSVLDPYEFVRLQNDATPGYANAYYYVNGKSQEDYKNVSGFDWQKLCMNQNPMFQNHSVSLSARFNKTAYTVSGSYTDQVGLIINSGFKRYQGRVTLDQNVSDQLKVGFNINYSNSTTTGTAGNASFGNYLSFLTNLWTYRPVLGGSALNTDYENFIASSVYDPNESQGRINPYLATTNGDIYGNSTVFTPNGYLEFKFSKNLTFRSTIGMSLTNIESYQFNNASTYDGNPYTGFGMTYGMNGSRSNSQSYSLLNENTLTYNKKFSNSSLNALIGFTNQQNSIKSYGFRATNMPSADLGINGLYMGTPYSVTSASSSSGLLSYLGRINYNIEDKYLFTASMRADGSSKFSPNNRWGYFPSGAFAWRMNNENFLKNVENLDNAKLRISYGATGNNRVDDFSYMTLLATSTTSIVSINEANQYASYVSKMGNANLKWETGVQGDIGLDLAFFKNRLSLELDYYDRVTQNLLLNATMPYYTGFSSAYENIGKVSNSGLEITINTININHKYFKWSSSFNISFNKNRLLALNSGANELLTSKSFTMSPFSNTNDYIGKIGAPVAMFNGFISNGIYQLSDFYKVQNGPNGYTYVLKEGIPYYGQKQSLSSINSNAPQNCVQPGDVKFKDLNGDGIIDQNDVTVIGSPYPIHFGGFSNTFTYKNFDLNVFLQWSYGNQILNANRLMMEGSFISSSTATSGTVGMVNYNQYSEYANRWTYTNPSNIYPRVDSNQFGTRAYSTRVIEDGSYLRLKTIQLGYTLPVILIKKIGITSARFYLSAQNLLTLAGYSGIDPEVSTASGSNLTPGFDYSPYPRTKVITIGTTIIL
ncbi:MAG: TonB-dependent receptor [Paludibacter sp.]|nr:TonB-dependent receptor [Paludibacter sp.]